MGGKTGNLGVNFGVMLVFGVKIKFRGLGCDGWAVWAR